MPKNETIYLLWLDNVHKAKFLYKVKEIKEKFLYSKPLAYFSRLRLFLNVVTLAKYSSKVYFDFEFDNPKRFPRAGVGRGTYHFTKSRTPLAKIFLFSGKPPKITKNPIALKKLLCCLER